MALSRHLTADELSEVNWKTGGKFQRHTMHYDVIIVGGGIVGLATAFRILEARSAARILLLEKEARLAAHQTGNNSGVLHSGLYYKPGSEKAKLSVSGLGQMIAFCRQYGVAYEQCGKIVVATNENELPWLENLWQRGNANGLLGLRKLTREQIGEIEPHAAGLHDFCGQRRYGIAGNPLAGIARPDEE